jgi:ABC-type antimicrobial peptide transport system ATPase subunit
MLGEDLRLSIALAAQPRIMRRPKPKSIGNPAATSKVCWRIVERLARQSARSLILINATNSGESKILEL